MTRAIALLALLLAGFHPAGSDNVMIAQIDATSLLLNQRVGLYVSVTDENGQSVEGLGMDRFRVLESADGENFQAVPAITGFRPGANRSQGINFLLLIDNSGSMYDTLDDRPTEAREEMRISLAGEAVRAFIGSITNPRDSLGLATFNSDYTLHVAPAGRGLPDGGYLESIQRPTREQAYTELYAGLLQAAEDISGQRGRRVIIVLSDGVNYPFAQYEGRPHPRFGERIFQYTEPIELCQREGISIFAINFGREKDRHLEAIALETGGAVFDAANREELSEIYGHIRERVQREYLISYRATMDPADRKHVRVEYQDGGEIRQSTRFYFSSTVFGLPARSLGWWLLLPFLLALALWVLLTRLRLERASARPSLEVLAADRGVVATRLFDLSGGKTVIGGDDAADVTISGVPTVRRNHATIVFDEGSRNYTIMAEGDLTVNNRPVRRRQLEEGDVINVQGTTFVFHEPPKTRLAGEKPEPADAPPKPDRRRTERKPDAKSGREKARQAPRQAPRD